MRGWAEGRRGKREPMDHRWRALASLTIRVAGMGVLLASGFAWSAEGEEDGGGEDETVEISAERPPATAGERPVGRDAVATIPERSADDLLRLSPGLHASAHGGQGRATHGGRRAHPLRPAVARIPGGVWGEGGHCRAGGEGRSCSGAPGTGRGTAPWG